MHTLNENNAMQDFKTYAYIYEYCLLGYFLFSRKEEMLQQQNPVLGRLVW